MGRLDVGKEEDRKRDWNFHCGGPIKKERSESVFRIAVRLNKNTLRTGENRQRAVQGRNTEKKGRCCCRGEQRMEKEYQVFRFNNRGRSVCKGYYVSQGFQKQYPTTHKIRIPEGNISKIPRSWSQQMAFGATKGGGKRNCGEFLDLCKGNLMGQFRNRDKVLTSGGGECFYNRRGKIPSTGVQGCSIIGCGGEGAAERILYGQTLGVPTVFRPV